MTTLKLGLRKPRGRKFLRDQYKKRDPIVTGSKADKGGLICGGLIPISLYAGFLHPPLSWIFLPTFLIGLPTLIAGLQEMGDIQFNKKSILTHRQHPLGAIWLGMIAINLGLYLISRCIQ